MITLFKDGMEENYQKEKRKNYQNEEKKALPKKEELFNDGGANLHFCDNLI